MDVSEKDYIPEGSHEAESKIVSDQSVLVKEADNGDQRKSGIEPAPDSAVETEPDVPLEQAVEVNDTVESKAEQALEDGSNGVSPAVEDSASVPKVANSFPEPENGVSSIDKELDENNGNSSVGRTEPDSADADSVSKQAVETVSKPAEACSVDAENEAAGSTEDEPLMDVTRSPLQRASWWGCCGLFHVIRRSDD